MPLHNNIIEIGDQAFDDCYFRGILNLPENLLIIGERAFRGNQFSGELKFPQSLSVLGGQAFESNQRLTGIVEFPEELISITPSVFANCSNLQGVVISKNVETIREGAFENCI